MVLEKGFYSLYFTRVGLIFGGVVVGVGNPPSQRVILLPRGDFKCVGERPVTFQDCVIPSANDHPAPGFVYLLASVNMYLNCSANPVCGSLDYS